MKKHLTLIKFASLLVFLALLAAPASLPAQALASKDYLAELYAVNVAVQPDGALLVTETIHFRFQGGPFTRVFRELELNELDAIEDVQAYLDGRPLPPGGDEGQVEISGRDPLEVVWHFAPLSDSTHEFTLTYRVLGALRDGETGDSLRWWAIPPEHDYPIENVRVTLELPAEQANLLRNARLEGAQAQAQPLENGVSLEGGPVGEDDGVQLIAEFDPALVAAPPAWQARQLEFDRRMRQAIPIALASGGLVLLAGLAGLFLFSRRYQRDQDLTTEAAFRPSSPPASVLPAVAARLLGGATPSLAALFDLAQRGVLRFEETGSARKDRRYKLVRDQVDSPLAPPEQALLEALFSSKGGEINELPLHEVGQRLTSGANRINAALEAELTRLGWLDPERQAARSRLNGIMLFALLLGVPLFVAGFFLRLPLLTGLFLGFGAGLFLLGLVGVIYALSFSPLSDQGARQAALWRGFSAYLNDIARGREPAPRPDLFDLYLPFAAGFGLVEAWVEYFRKQGNTPPAWFGGLNASMTDFTAITAAIVASSAASAGAGVSAAGASGGGASGAG